eukprot:147072-Chlamydomonas_euryale.AAC.1
MGRTIWTLRRDACDTSSHMHHLERVPLPHPQCGSDSPPPVAVAVGSGSGSGSGHCQPPLPPVARH